ncbi:MAG: nicotinate (nicotinamide) nucleotide adenylyltransferase [Rhodothermales bacterium]|nr:nicotinate (nicotinamide) nucleotide adenylyltransferase [Rhodothermales bacterium]
MRVGVFGGTFNPPHLGHRVIAEQAVEALGLDRLIWIPALQSPLKEPYGQASAHHRLAMTSLAAANHPAFSVSDLETRRQPPSYTVDTLRALKTEHPDWTLHLLIGTDSWDSFERWRAPEEIRSLAEVVVYPRGANTSIDSDAAGVTFLDAPTIAVSSTMIRARVAGGAALAGLLDTAVLDYVRAHHLYEDPNAEGA